MPNFDLGIMGWIETSFARVWFLSWSNSFGSVSYGGSVFFSYDWILGWEFEKWFETSSEEFEFCGTGSDSVYGEEFVYHLYLLLRDSCKTLRCE